jgi:hypothetical protein
MKYAREESQPLSANLSPVDRGLKFSRQGCSWNCTKPILSRHFQRRIDFLLASAILMPRPLIEARPG